MPSRPAPPLPLILAGLLACTQVGFVAAAGGDAQRVTERPTPHAAEPAEPAEPDPPDPPELRRTRAPTPDPGDAAGRPLRPRPGERLRLPAGTELFAVASDALPPVAVLAEPTPAEVVDRHGAWLRVRTGTAGAGSSLPGTAGPAGRIPSPAPAAPRTLTGWVLPGRDRPANPPQIARTAAGPPPGAGAATATAARLEHARSLLGPTARRLRAGPFDLLTDVADEELAAALQRLAPAVVDLYRRRYGLPVPGSAGPLAPAPATAPATPATVVLFRDEAALGAFDEAVAAARLPGLTAGSVAALHAGDRTRSQVGRLFVHEVVHLLNRHALGPAPPPWLDEGLAGDLELFPVTAGGELLEIPLDRRAARLADHRPYGPLVGLERLILDARRGRLEPLDHLAALGADELRRPPRAEERYALAALWVRFLLDGGDRDRAAAFRAGLGRLAAPGDPGFAPAGDPPAGEGPPGALPFLSPGEDLRDLEADLHRWLADLYRRFTAPPRP